MSTILDQIIATKRSEIARAKHDVPQSALEAALADAPPVRSFLDALAHGQQIRLIAEVKKASPSKGVIREDFQPTQIARWYEQAGASCISVLTDRPYFQGSLDYLRQIRQAVSIPLLRKDFILDAYQLLEARVAGADAVLLIAECLLGEDLPRLHDEAIQLGMTPLVELYDRANLQRVTDAGATLIGVNNRDLKTFKVDLDHTIRLRQEISETCLVVAESGIATRQDVERLERAGIDAMLVGEGLMKQPNIVSAVQQLLGRS